MKPALLLLLGVGVTDLVALNAFVVPRLLAPEAATATVPPAATATAPLTPSERPGRESRRLAVASPRLAAAAARSGQPGGPPEPPEGPPEPPEARPGRPEAPAPLYFATDRATIYPAAAAVLDDVAAALARDPRLTLHVTAHACAAGADAYNLALTQRRARRVIEYLAAHDIDPARIVTVARGERDAHASRPDAREDRRVDLRFEAPP